MYYKFNLIYRILNANINIFISHLLIIYLYSVGWLTISILYYYVHVPIKNDQTIIIMLYYIFYFIIRQIEFILIYIIILYCINVDLYNFNAVRIIYCLFLNNYINKIIFLIYINKITQMYTTSFFFIRLYPI